MKNREVRWWLLGFLELCHTPLDQKKITVIKNHLNLARAVEGNLDELNATIEERLNELTAHHFPASTIATFQQELHTSLTYSLRMQSR